MSKKFFSQFRSNVIKGMLAVVPITLTYITLRFVYEMIDKRILNTFSPLIPIHIPGLGVLILVVTLYLLGSVSTTFIMKRVWSWFEFIIDKIPLVKTTYTIGKQISATFSLDSHQAFKKSVFIHYITENSWVLGFVTGEITDKRNGDFYYKVFIPTPPNPTTGYIVVVKKELAIDTGWTVEESLKSVISVGIVTPEFFGVETAK